MYKFIIPEVPTGKGRPRAAYINRRVVMYTPKKTCSYEELVKWCYRKDIGNDKVADKDEPVRVEILAYFPIPKSTPKKYIPAMLDGRIRPTKKPDVDNITKIILDGLNGVAYDDDKQVTNQHCVKYYSSEPRVEVYIGAELQEQPTRG